MIQTINVGSTANDGTGYTLRNSFIIVNDNFTYVESGKANTIHSHIISDITGLQDQIDIITSLSNEVSDISDELSTMNGIVRLNQIESQLNSINSSISTINSNIIDINQKIIDIINQIN